MDNKNTKDKWIFGIAGDEIGSVVLPSMRELYKQSLFSREERRKTIEAGIQAALDDLLRWEQMAHAEGFDVKCLTDEHLGAPHPVFEGNKIYFVQSYGVCVLDLKGESKENRQ